MNTPTTRSIDLDRIETWTKYRKTLCTTCQASCCRLPVEVWTEDLIRMELIDPFEKNDPPKQIAKKLRKAGIIDHFNYKNAIFFLARRANDDCLYLDETTRRCTIYDKRPQTCRNHPQIGPRAGYCAYQQQD
ncbi:MAG: YkgJ family cysteine cluster protein [Proteobacteria bacterium]|nr:YkgJ family cysteine cluster protein [Pseudomonadota bacterium]MBU1687870.1 YkgJ family cysteine cluster protein [Pseudomonadota bacterium]